MPFATRPQNFTFRLTFSHSDSGKGEIIRIFFRHLKDIIHTFIRILFQNFVSKNIRIFHTHTVYSRLLLHFFQRHTKANRWNLSIYSSKLPYPFITYIVHTLHVHFTYIQKSPNFVYKYITSKSIQHFTLYNTAVSTKILHQHPPSYNKCVIFPLILLH